MKIQKHDLYHGAALAQIVKHDSFKALNRASNKFGHYLVNTDRHVFIKHRTNRKSPWQHTFSPDEVQAIADAIAERKKVWLCLVCGEATICALTRREIKVLLDLNGNSQQFITIKVPSGGSCRANGSKGTLKGTIPHNSFPGKIFK